MDEFKIKCKNDLIRMKLDICKDRYNDRWKVNNCMNK